MPSRAVDRRLLNAVATLNTAVVYAPKLLPGFVGAGTTTSPTLSHTSPQQGFHHHISWATGVTAGTVVVEYSDSADGTYAGTWAPVATIAWSATSPSQDYA